MKETLYKKDSKGNIREWSIELNGLSNTMMIYSGILGGSMINTNKIIHEGTNIGKLNERSPYEQVIFEIEAEIKKKRKEGYRSLEDLGIIPAYREDKYTYKENNEYSYDLKDILEEALSNTKQLGKDNIQQPMLAHKYDETKKQSSSKDLKGWGLENKPFFLQPKLDGVRCLAKVETYIDATPNNVTLYSRTGELIQGFLKIQLDILKVFEEHDIYPENGITWLDGELYTPDIPFQTLNGLVRKGDKNSELEDQVKYHIYDVINDKPQHERIEFLKFLNLDETKFLKGVETVKCFNTLYEEGKMNIIKAHNHWISLGYEGAIIRRYDGLYENKRSKNLLKVKQFEDAEFIIIGGEEAKTNNMLGAFIVANEKTIIRPFHLEGFTRVTTLESDKSFNATPKATIKERQEMLKNLDSYIGKTVTVEYFGVSEDNIPRFPRVIKIH